MGLPRMVLLVLLLKRVLRSQAVGPLAQKAFTSSSTVMCNPHVSPVHLRINGMSQRSWGGLTPVSLLNAGGGQELRGERGAWGKAERSSLPKSGAAPVLGSGRLLLRTNEGPMLPGL